jgi:hypothetical protein
MEGILSLEQETSSTTDPSCSQGCQRRREYIRFWVGNAVTFLEVGYRDRVYGNQRLMTVNIEIEPELLEPLFGDDPQLRSIPDSIV